MNTSPKFTRKDGMLTRYAFGCGYMQTFTFHPSQDFYGSDDDAVTMLKPSPGGEVWHVRYRIGGKTLWSQFDTYDEALAFWKAYRRLIRAREDVHTILTAA